MEKSYASPDEILETKHSQPRPISMPSSVIGYLADLIINIAEFKVKKINDAGK